MKNKIEERKYKGSPIIMPPEKEREVHTDEESQYRIDHSSPEQFAEHRDANLRMIKQDFEGAE